MEIIIGEKDREILRETAKKQLEYANMESNLQRKKEWYLHNELKGERPMVQLELGTFAHEIIPQRLRCQGEFARMVERTLYENFLNQELFDDDRVTPDYYPMAYDKFFNLFDIPVKVEHTTDEQGGVSVGHHFVSVIKDLGEDYRKLKKSTFGTDMDSTLKKQRVIEDAIGDILPVKIKMDGLYSVPTQMIVHIMSMEDMMFAMYDYPELFKEMMDRIAQDTLEYFRMLEEKRLIMPTTSFEGVGNGTWAFTHELPGGRNMKSVL